MLHTHNVAHACKQTNKQASTRRQYLGRHFHRIQISWPKVGKQGPDANVLSTCSVYHHEARMKGIPGLARGCKIARSISLPKYIVSITLLKTLCTAFRLNLWLDTLTLIESNNLSWQGCLKLEPLHRRSYAVRIVLTCKHISLVVNQSFGHKLDASLNLLFIADTLVPSEHLWALS